MAKNGFPPVFCGQERCALSRAMQSIGDEADDIVEQEGRQHDFLNLADRLQRPHQRMHNGDLVVYIGSDTGGSRNSQSQDQGQSGLPCDPERRSLSIIGIQRKIEHIEIFADGDGVTDFGIAM